MKSQQNSFNMEKKRHKGKIKFFSYRRGYGFIVPENKSLGEDVFFHFSSIGSLPGMVVYLIPNENVEFELIKGPRGFLARNVVSKNKITDEHHLISSIDKKNRIQLDGMEPRNSHSNPIPRKMSNIYYHYYHSFRKIMNNLIEDEIGQIEKDNKTL